MKKPVILLMALCTAVLMLQAQTNDFYDDALTGLLSVPRIEVTGEIANPGIADLSLLPLHSIICKETRLQDDSAVFVGAYRYDGYSLYDILNDRILKKKNEMEFSPIIDLFVEVENNKGEKVVFSWGEIYYPSQRHNIIIAIQVTRIVPSKTKELWPLPEEPKLVAGCDLVSERNISNPVKITVRSYPESFPVKRDMDPLYSPEIRIFNNAELITTLKKYPDGYQKQHYPTVFYGRGRGIHGISTFNGVPIDDLLGKEYAINAGSLRHGLFAIVAADGYRCVFSYSEIFNRNDQQKLLLIDRKGDMDGGDFSVFPAFDFFSDRSVKAISVIYYDEHR
ncbi:MAG: hypothetical protein NT175_12775 [Bacteroidetes bacterium]|nr:hypothetical protein [Bacteroidota bacterium]